MQLGGITTAGWTPNFDPEGPTMMSWALNNHWMVNFKASQGGLIGLRYRLTTHGGQCDDSAAARFAAEAATPPLILRDYVRHGDASGSLLVFPEDAGLLVSAKPAEDGDGLVVRLQDMRGVPSVVPVCFTLGNPTSACLTSPVEVDGEALAIEGGMIRVPLGRRVVQSLRVRF